MANPDHSFTNEGRVRTIDTCRIVYLVTAAFWFLSTEIGRYAYRPFIYARKIDDYGIADSIGNSGGIIVLIFFLLTILNPLRKYVLHVAAFVAIGCILYEIAQPYLPHGVFDWKDIYGTLIGGVIALLFLLILNKVIKENRTYYVFKKKSATQE